MTAAEEKLLLEENMDVSRQMILQMSQPTQNEEQLE